MNTIKHFFLILSILCLPIGLFASEDNAKRQTEANKFKDYKEKPGKHYYEQEESPKIPEPKEQPPSPPKQKSPMSESATEQMNRLKAQIEETKNMAILYPTDENVYKWLKTQKAILDRGDNFSKAFAKVVTLHPELDYANTQSSNEFNNKYEMIEKYEKLNTALKELGKVGKIFFFFNHEDEKCQAQYKVLKYMKTEFGVDYYPISVTGKGFDDMDPGSFKVDNGISQQLNLIDIPGTYFVIPSKNEFFLLAYNLISATKIKSKLMIISDHAGLLEKGIIPDVYKVKKMEHSVNDILQEAYNKIDADNNILKKDKS